MIIAARGTFSGRPSAAVCFRSRRTSAGVEVRAALPDDSEGRAHLPADWALLRVGRQQRQ